ncbi:uncharacterized protein LOC129761133 [Toxorhynchites rutilus septentrionalis]|uniref:uncharacterized protein LOC129761133 n=1 Tax=Toxorhynchites rutilus septentrionalis TaxID=329112 RepID=UPI002479E3C2|nr:uncharacterized protein LOC129761133 [Toxorhynchites rutilus septentrionalis]
MADKKIKEKIKKRDRIVASLLRQADFLEAYDELQTGQIQARLEKLEKKWDEFEEVQEEIAALDEKGEYKEECLNIDKEFEAQYFEIRVEFLEKLQATTTPAGGFDTSVVRNNTALGNHTGVRLPQISLPEFNGDYRNWLSFESTFVSLIHESNDINDVQKFHYLKSALKGEAAKLIQSLTVTGENYIIAWETITKRYSNEYLLRKRHLQALMEYPKLEHESAAAIHGLVDEFEQRLKILKQLGEHTEHWGAMIVHWMCSKLDKLTLQLWEDHVVSIKEPSFTILVEFLERRTRVLEAVLSNTVEAMGKSTVKRQRAVVSATTEAESRSSACCCCGDQHHLVKCSRFQKMKFNERLQFVNTKRLCSNCFRTGHWVRDCNSKSNCRTCDKRHHTMIHPGFPAGTGMANIRQSSSKHAGQKDAQGTSSLSVTDGNGASTREDIEEPSVGSYNVGISSNKSNVFLSTIILTIRDCNGRKHLARALLDNGSQINIISEHLCQILRLRRRAVSVPICGIGRTECTARQTVSATIGSRTTGFSEEFFLAMQRITTELPSVTVPVQHWRIPQNMQLADPEFNIRNSIDLLLGAERFYNFVLENTMKKMSLGPNLPVLVDTVFGWIVSGRALYSTEQVVGCCLAAASENLDHLLERFWRVESIDDTPAWSKDEKDCEEHFVRTHSRDIDGRYVVQLPKRINYEKMLGNSRSIALKRFINLEKRLKQDADMRCQYNAFMAEYLQLGHMREVDPDKLKLETENGFVVCYLPHHAVLKQSSTTTKVRVVFDGSAQTDSGYSLNQSLLKGPTIQDELLYLLLRFRKHEVALIGDLEKMYRQVKVDDNDAKLQRIFWRFTCEEPMKEYELLTVTYGLTPSSFLATRVLRQLAEDEGDKSTEAKIALTNDFYVDDYIGGAPSVEAAVVLREQLTELLAKGGFLIRKWCSNKLEALDGVPAHHLGTRNQIDFDITSNDEVKTLGISWIPTTDQLRFSFSISAMQTEWTKRRILSSIAKLFDPLGLISPIIVTAKIFMQEFALLHCGWDDPVPSEMAERWLTFYEKLEGLSELRIDRFAFISGWVSVQLHCFADASELAYGICIYVRSVDCTGNVQVELLSSKSRVAPLKRFTIPRLELCAAKEAGMLYEKVSKALSLDKIPAYFWSDSTIVLHWLKSPPNRWKTFVANRVSSVQTSTYGHVWKHVSGKDNPADLVSRGMPVKEFIQSKLWRRGPEWLQDPNNWPKNGPDDSFTYEDLELRVSLPALAVSTQPDPLFYLRSSLNSLLRIVSYCLRFGHNTRFQAKHITGPLAGRLRNSSIDYVTKHQAILPSHHPFTCMNSGRYTANEWSMQFYADVIDASVSTLQKYTNPSVNFPEHVFAPASLFQLRAWITVALSF